MSKEEIRNNETEDLNLDDLNEVSGGLGDPNLIKPGAIGDENPVNPGNPRTAKDFKTA